MIRKSYAVDTTNCSNAPPFQTLTAYPCPWGGSKRPPCHNIVLHGNPCSAIQPITMGFHPLVLHLFALGMNDCHTHPYIITLTVLPCNTFMYLGLLYRQCSPLFTVICFHPRYKSINISTSLFPKLSCVGCDLFI